MCIAQDLRFHRLPWCVLFGRRGDITERVGFIEDVGLFVAHFDRRAGDRAGVQVATSVLEAAAPPGRCR